MSLGGQLINLFFFMFVEVFNNLEQWYKRQINYWVMKQGKRKKIVTAIFFQK